MITMIPILIILAVVFLAHANGANDNFKGVASLFGSRACSYGTALSWATITTFAGSIAAIFFASVLLKNFSGKGLVTDAIAQSSAFSSAVAGGAGAGQAKWNSVTPVLESWIITLPATAGLSAVCYIVCTKLSSWTPRSLFLVRNRRTIVDEIRLPATYTPQSYAETGEFAIS